MKHVDGGLVVAIDGVDGVGKTTQIASLVQHYRDQDYRVNSFAVSGGTPIGEAIRTVIHDKHLPRSARTDLFMVMAMHSELGIELQHFRRLGGIALLDRSSIAIWAYQVHASGLDPDYAMPKIQEDITSLQADTTLLLRAPYAIAPSYQLNRSISLMLKHLLYKTTTE